MVKYYGYFAHVRAARIEEIAAATRASQELGMRTSSGRQRILSRCRSEASREIAGLERARAERAGAVPALSEQVQSGNESSRASSTRSRRSSRWSPISRECCKDFPVDSEQSFEQLRGKLPWPVSGKMTVALSGDARPRRSERGATERRDDRGHARRQGARALLRTRACTPTGCRAWDCSSSSRTAGIT